MTKLKTIRVALFVWLLLPAAALRAGTQITIIHVNDVYEVQGVGGEGGMARLATIVEGVRKTLQPSITILAGDALSPSGMSSVLKNAGEQMAEAMGFLIAGEPLIEYAVLGNHEFDLKATDFNARTAAKTKWFSGNVTLTSPWNPVPQNAIIDRGGVRIALIGATIGTNAPKGVTFEEAAAALRRDVQVARKQKADFIIAVTHLDRSYDRDVVSKIDGIDLVLGGHDHQASVDPGDACKQTGDAYDCKPRGKSAAVFKADANARTYWRHVLTFDDNRKFESMTSTLERLTASPQADVQEQIVKKYEKKLAADTSVQDAFGETALTDSLGIATSTLDGREACVRNTANCKDGLAMLKLVATGADCVSDKPDVVLYNGGLIRIDDTIADGTGLTPMDVLRINPFGDRFVLVNVPRKDVTTVVKNSHAHCGGKGCWLHAFPTGRGSGSTVKVALPEFLLKGSEEVVGTSLAAWPKPVGGERGDIRKGLAAAIRGKCTPVTLAPIN